MNNEKERTEVKLEGLEEVRKGKLRTLETKLSASVEETDVQAKPAKETKLDRL